MYIQLLTLLTHTLKMRGSMHSLLVALLALLGLLDKGNTNADPGVHPFLAKSEAFPVLGGQGRLKTKRAAYAQGLRADISDGWNEMLRIGYPIKRTATGVPWRRRIDDIAYYQGQDRKTGSGETRDQWELAKYEPFLFQRASRTMKTSDKRRKPRIIGRGNGPDREPVLRRVSRRISGGTTQTPMTKLLYFSFQQLANRVASRDNPRLSDKESLDEIDLPWETLY